MAPASTATRIKRWFTLAVVLLVVVGAAELLRRHYDREQEVRIRKALVYARSTGHSPKETEPEWDRLAESLRSRVRSDPTGALAKLAYRASARVTLQVPRYFPLSEHPTIPVVYGDRPPDEIPVPHESYLWIAEVEGSWDRGEWRKIGEGSWGPDGPSRGELDIAAAMPEEIPPSGWATLHLRLSLRLYVDEQAEEAARASSPEELARVRTTQRESMSLGGHRVKIVEGETAPESP